MHLVTSVCVYVTKKLTCLVPYRSKKNTAECIILLACEVKHLQSVFLCPASCANTEQFVLVLFRPALE